MEALKQI